MATPDIVETTSHAPKVHAADAVFQKLREAIATGTYPEGSKLPSESKLASAFGVSRPVVREALQGCAALGLTETRVGSGTVVRSRSGAQGLSLGNYTARELHEARPHIEMPAAALAASRRTDADLESLASLLTNMAEITAGTSTQGAREWVEQDAMFHAAIARASRNGVFESFIAEIREALARQSQLLATAARRQEHSDREHRAIFEAIAAGDAEAALHAMSLHLHAVADAVDSLTTAHLHDIRDADGTAS